MLEELGLTAEQKSVVNQVITANNHTGAVYGAVTYRVVWRMESGFGGRWKRLCDYELNH